MSRRRASLFVISLIGQLDFFNDEKESLLEKLFPNSQTPIELRVQANALVAQYVIELERMISRMNPESRAMVMVGSYVTLQSTVNKEETMKLVLCFPIRAEPDRGWISFLSPIGMQLMLRRIGEIVQVPFDSGERSVKVMNIQFLLEASCVYLSTR
jgi:transcription elongation factor GreA